MSEILPPELVVDEDKALVATIRIRNQGNQPADFELTYNLDGERTQQPIQGKILVGKAYSAEINLPVKRSSKTLLLVVKYNAVNGQPRSLRQEVPIKVRERKDKVEISFGGLDDLDQ